MRFLILILLGLISIPTSALLLHPAHKARCSFKYDFATQIIELEMRFSDQDVEDFARLQKNIHLDLDKASNEQVQQIFAEYLSTHIALKNAKGINYKWEWVGFEKKAPFVWFYLQSPFDKGQIDKTAKPSIDVFCALQSEFNFLIDLYENQTLLQSLISTCNTHLHIH